MKKKKITNIITSGMIASTLIFSLGAGPVFANGDESVPTETINLDEQASEITLTDATTVDGTEQVEVEVEIEDPSIVPGDFFYFVKLMAEKVRLAFTFNDYKEAQLLAEVAAERIAEANALLAEGKTAEAEELLKEAISTQDLASEILPVGENGTDEAATEEAEGEVIDLAVSEESKGDALVSAASEETEDEGTAVDSKLAHNIDALLVVLEKVENPKAQKVMMKNIQKTFAKLDKKFTKLAAKEAKLTEEIEKADGQVTGDTVDVEDGTTVGESDTAVEETTEAAAVSKAEEKAKKAEAKQQAEVKKAEDKAKKAEAKQQAQAKKAEEKQQRQANKAEAKQEKQNKKAEEKGKN